MREDCLLPQEAPSCAMIQDCRIVNRLSESRLATARSHSEGGTITAFSRVVRGRTLTFETTKQGTLDVVDKETGSKWTAWGECISGQMKGSKLVKITPLPSFWFSWAQFFPQTEVYSIN